MNSDKITKLYAALTNKERAALILNSLVECNEREVRRIDNSIPRKSYKSRDAEYSRWFDAMWDVCTFVAIEYWRLEACKQRDLARYMFFLRGEDRIKSEQAYQCFIKGHQHVLALNCALDMFCERHGISAAAVRRFGDIVIEAGGITDIKADDSLLPSYDEKLSGLLPI